MQNRKSKKSPNAQKNPLKGTNRWVSLNNILMIHGRQGPVVVMVVVVQSMRRKETKERAGTRPIGNGDARRVVRDESNAATFPA